MKVMIDPGHGGEDPGATGKGLREKDITLDLGLALRRELSRYRCEIRMTREEDIIVELPERTDMANAWGAGTCSSVCRSTATVIPRPMATRTTFTPGPETQLQRTEALFIPR